MTWRRPRLSIPIHRCTTWTGRAIPPSHGPSAPRRSAGAQAGRYPTDIRLQSSSEPLPPQAPDTVHDWCNVPPPRAGSRRRPSRSLRGPRERDVRTLAGARAVGIPTGMRRQRNRKFGRSDAPNFVTRLVHLGYQNGERRIPFGRLIRNNPQSLEFRPIVKPKGATDFDRTPHLRNLRKLKRLKLHQRPIRDLRVATLRGTVPSFAQASSLNSSDLKNHV